MIKYWLLKTDPDWVIILVLGKIYFCFGSVIAVARILTTTWVTATDYTEQYPSPG